MTGEAGQIMDNQMFFITFPNVAYALQYFVQSRNNNNRPNKKNDVITDLGGEGNFPMFLSGQPLFSDFQLASLSGTLASVQRRRPEDPVSRWITIP